VNALKTYELIQKDFTFLYNADYLSPQVKEDLGQQAAAEALIGGTPGDYNEPPSNTTAKNTYQ